MSTKSWPWPGRWGSTWVPTRPSSTGSISSNSSTSSTRSCRRASRSPRRRWSRPRAAPATSRAPTKTRSTPGCGSAGSRGAADGLLAGKTVSFKDHIAVAGVPMSFGSFALEGLHPGLRRHRRDPGAPGGRHDRRQERHERPERRLRDRRRHRRLRPAAQPPQPRARDRRIVVGLRRRRGGRPGGHLVRRRPGRLDPHPGGVLRHRRPQAHVRAGLAFRDRVRLGPEHRLHRADGPHRGGRGGGAPGHGGPRRATIRARRATSPRSMDVLSRLADGVSRRCASAWSRRASTTPRRTCATWSWPPSTSSPKAGATVSEVSIPEHHAVRAAQDALGRRRRSRCSRPASSARSPGPTTRPRSSPRSTRCGPPTPTCSRRAPSCR